MQRSKCLAREARLAAERSSKCWGTASVNISILDFPNEEDEEDVEALTELFRSDFRGLNPRYHIPAKIDGQHLDAALELSGLTADNLKASPHPRHGYPELRFPTGFRLQCCQGLHRAKAATKVLAPGARLWSIDFYDSNIGPDLDIELSEEYSAEKIPDDGVVYCKIRKYQGYRGIADSFLERRWWALIEYYSKRKKDNMKKILDDPDYREAFDIQLEIPALGDGMQLGVIHKLFTMKCHELLLNYLGYIRDVWKVEICQGNEEWMRRIDPGTVRAVQHTAPGACSRDREDLYRKVQSGQIFGAFGEQERQSLWAGLVSASLTRLIPSLFTFFEDVNYLEGPLESLKRLVPPCRKETISSALLRAYKDVNQESDQCIIQESDSTFAFVPGTEADRVEIGVRQAWICSMRKSTEIPPQPKKKESIRRANPEYKESARAVHELASFLHLIGFESAEILHTIEQSADSVVAHNALLEARPPDCFAYDELALDNHKRQMIGFFMTARELPTDEALRLAELDNFVLSPKRYGKPSEAERKQTKPMLFADRLHAQDVFDDVTPFFVRRSVYLAFFGTPMFDHANIRVRRRVQLDNRPMLQDSSHLIRERQLQERERRLEEEWQRVKSEETKLGNVLAENSARYEEQVKRLEEESASQLDRKLSEIKANFEGEVAQYQAGQAKMHKERHEKQLEEIRRLDHGRLQLEEEIKTLKDAIKRREEERMPEQENRLRTQAQERLENERKNFEGRLQQVENEKQELQNAANQAEQDRASWGEIQRRFEEEKKNFEERLQQVENEKQQLQNAANQAEQDRASLGEIQRRFEEEKKNFEERLQRVENEKQQLQNAANQAEQDRASLGEIQRRFEEEKKNFEERLQRVENEKQQLQIVANKGTSEAQSEQLLQQNKDLERRVQELQTDKTATIEKLETAIDELKRDRERIEVERAKLETKLGKELSLLTTRDKQLDESRNQLKEKEIQLEDSERQLKETRAQLAERGEAIAQERNDLNQKIQDMLREKAELQLEKEELRKEREQLSQEWEICQAEASKPAGDERLTREEKTVPNAQEGNPVLLPPQPTENPVTRSTPDGSSNVKNNMLGAKYRAKDTILQKLGRLADREREKHDQAREKRQRIDGKGNDKPKKSQQADTEVNDQSKTGAADEVNDEAKSQQTDAEVNDQSKTGGAGLLQSTRSKGKTGAATSTKEQRRGTKERRGATQIKAQDAVAAKPSEAIGMTEAADLGVPITFIFEDSVPAREELIPAAQVEAKARQLKAKTYELFDKKGLTLNAKTCYEDVIADGTRAIVVRLKMDADEDAAVRKRKVQEP